MEKCLNEIVDLIRNSKKTINVKEVSEFIRHELEKNKTTFQK